MSWNLFDKNCTQENFQLHIQHGESWLRRIVIGKLQVTAYIYGTKLCSHTFKSSSEEVTAMYSLKMKAKYMKEDVWKFFSWTYRLASCNFIID